jgi:hypothetical protein
LARTVGRFGVSGGPGTIRSEAAPVTSRSAVPCAVTVNVYGVPLVRPVKMQYASSIFWQASGVAVAGLAVTKYASIGPPSGLSQ